MRIRPRPSEPNSGLTTTSPPSSSKASRAAAADWPAQVAGTGRPACASEGQRQVLVDGRLDGAGRIEHGDARRGDPVQGIHPEDDLFEAAGRHHPHQHAVDVHQVHFAGLDRSQRCPARATEAETSAKGTA